VLQGMHHESREFHAAQGRAQRMEQTIADRGGQVLSSTWTGGHLCPCGLPAGYIHRGMPASKGYGYGGQFYWRKGRHLCEEVGEKKVRVPCQLLDDEQFVTSMVRCDGLLLKYATPTMRATHSVVLAAVEQNPMALKDAAKDLRGDADFVCAAVRADPRAILHAGKAAKLDPRVTAAVAGSWSKARQRPLMEHISQHAWSIPAVEDVVHGDAKGAITTILKCGWLCERGRAVPNHEYRESALLVRLCTLPQPLVQRIMAEVWLLPEIAEHVRRAHERKMRLSM